jgi:class 3 adenylate cyclase
MTTDAEVAILFADVVGSTQLYETLGDDRARETVAECLEIMKTATEENAGTVIKTMGDEVMATFETANAAITAAAAMQKRISDNEELIGGGDKVSIRIGCHFGPVVQENRDIFGSAVHTANRMTSQAKARQIITTDTMVQQLNEEWQALVRQIDIATVKGKRDEVALYEVLWQPEEATSMLPTIGFEEQGAEKPAKLVLSYNGNEVEMDAKRTSISMGRADENDLVVKGNLISRIHARVEKRRHRYFLIDESTNGTFIQTMQGEEVFVRRDSTELAGEGIIGLGRVAKPGSPLAIHYMLVR